MNSTLNARKQGRNAQNEVVTIRSLNAARDAATEAFREADVLVGTANVKVRDAKRTASSDPCDFTKAAQQAAEQEYKDALSRRETLKDELRRKNEAVRVFCYRGKSLSQNGKLVRL